MIAVIISIASSVVSGMTVFFLQRYFKQKSARDEERDRFKEKENMLILKNIHALGNLTHANAIALRDGKVNGEMHNALEDYKLANRELYEYLVERNAKN